MSMKNFILSLLLISMSFQINAQCDEISSTTITNPGTYNVSTLSESDGVRNGPDYSGSTIYYPTGNTSILASIVLVPGFISLESSIMEWGPFLASHGIVTMTIGTNSLFDQPAARSAALLDAIVSLKQENTRVNSPLNGELNTSNIAVGGWSMGGGGAQLAATSDGSIKAVMALCPWLNTGELSNEYLNHEVPTLIFSGEFDGVAPPASHADLHYEYMPENTPKLLYEIASAVHSVANSPSGGNGEVGLVGLSWLKKFLLNEECYCPILLEIPETSSEYTSNIDCETPTLSTQLIECNEGWSIISTYIAPVNTNFTDFISPLIDHLVIAKDNLGNAYLPDWDFNGIGDIEQGQGYLIKMQNALNLTVIGTQINSWENTISLNEGWNLIANYNTEITSSDSSFAQLLETQNVVIIKDYIGNALLPEWDYNGLGELFPGRGYQIKVSASCELQY
jgi:dienelactone hydrolase